MPKRASLHMTALAFIAESLSINKTEDLFKSSAF